MYDKVSGLVQKGRPTQGDVHIDGPLTNMTVAYMQDAAGFVADKVFPPIPVQKQSDQFFIYTRDDFNRDSMKKRADNTESEGDGWTLSTDSYFAHVWALHKDTGDQVAANADEQVELDFATTQFLVGKALLRKEISFATDFFTSGVWSTDKQFGSGAGESLPWDDDGATPLKNVSDARIVMKEETGFKPNTLVLGARVWESLKLCPDILDRLKYGQTSGKPAEVTLQVIAGLFEIDRILVMDAIQNTANQGATESNSFIGGNHGLLVYTPPAPGRFTPSAGYTFGWTGYTGASPMGTRIMKWYIQERRADRQEIELAYVQKQTGSDLGYFMQDVVTGSSSATS